MTRLFLAGLLWGAMALPAIAALSTGDIAPDFTAQASRDGKAFTFSLKEARKSGPVVVYFFPAAFTQGCNVQAHEFAVNHDKFVAAGASIIGVSLDDIGRLNAFSADPDYCGGKVPVASDAEGRVAKAYDLRVGRSRSGVRDTRGALIEHGFAERTTFIVTSEGRIAATVGGLAPAENVAQALAAVQRLAKNSMR